MLKQGPKTLY